MALLRLGPMVGTPQPFQSTSGRLGWVEVAGIGWAQVFFDKAAGRPSDAPALSVLPIAIRPTWAASRPAYFAGGPLSDRPPHWTLTSQLDSTDNIAFSSWVEVAAGWPFPFVSMSCWSPDAGRDVVENAIQIQPRLLRYPDARQIGIPTRVLWLPLLANAVIWGAISWGVTWALVLARRTSRRRTGRCWRCGYNIRTGGCLAVCPECGESAGLDVASRRVQSPQLGKATSRL